MYNSKHPFIVRSIRAVVTAPGGVVEHIVAKEFGEPSFQELRDAKDRANFMQQGMDEDCDPVRTYVYPSGSDVPVHAGLAKRFR